MEDEGKHSAVSSLLVVWHMDYIKQAKFKRKKVIAIPHTIDEENNKISAVTSKLSINKYLKYWLESNIIKPIKILPYLKLFIEYILFSLSFSIFLTWHLLPISN